MLLIKVLLLLQWMGRLTSCLKLGLWFESMSSMELTTKKCQINSDNSSQSNVNDITFIRNVNCDSVDGNDQYLLIQKYYFTGSIGM